MNESPRAHHTFADVAYDAIYIGGIGGGLVALFFLAYDIAVRGEAFFTPSLMGNVLFNRMAPDSARVVDMMAVSKFTLIHFIAFGVFGLGASYLTHLAEMRSKHPLLLMAVVFVILEAGFWIATSVAIPGVLHHIGAGLVAVANLIAAAGIALFLGRTHRNLWMRARKNLPPGLPETRTETSRPR